MSVPTEPLTLAAEFPVVTRDGWRALVASVLAKSGVAADADPEQALSSVSYDGITIRPLYTRADAPVEAAAPADRWAGWDVRQRVADGNAVRANAAMLSDLANGGTSLWLVVGAGGVAVGDLGAALDGVYLDLAPIALDAGHDTEAATRALLALAVERGVAPGELRGTLGADPIGLRARTGADTDLDLLGTLAALAPASLRVATVDATIYHDAGASDADEIAISLAVGVAYLRALAAAGLSVDDALRRIEFRYAVTADQFSSIAKLRAARRAWARIAEMCDASERGQYQHAVTSSAMLTQRDPWVNMLRGTIACFAAAVGGAEAITVAPFDAAVGLPDDFGRRIARNTHSVLHDESSLARVVDPAGGSWYVEALTDEMAQRAWASFTAIERAGGALAALDGGLLGELIESTRDRRGADIAHRRAPITGVTEFALLSEAPLRRDALPPVATGGPLAPHRWAEPFELLRDRSDAAPSRPVVYLATLGPVAAHSAREGFAANLFAAGGIATVSGPPEEFATSGATIACLCSSDKVYAEQAEPAAAALRAAGATQVYLAGKGSYAGVDEYLYVGVDALALLTSVLTQLGVQ